jgi:predicted methyltransferase
MKTMIRIVVATLLILTASTLSVFADEAAIVQAKANENRTDADRERDARSKPEVILELLDLRAGQSVADIFGGGGYYAVLMADIVGTDGEVILHNNTPYSKFVEKQNNERFGANQVPAITQLKSEVDDLKLAPGSLDAVLMVMSYHDLYVYSPDRGWGNTDVPLFFSQIHAALKPGGRLVIVDHAAADGSGKSAAQDIHRIDEVYAKQDIESNGFRFVTSSDVLRNPEDDRSKMVFDPSIRGKTDRFILLFERE